MHRGEFLAVSEANDIEKDKFSGIVGLAPASDTGKIKSFVEQVEDLNGEGGVDNFSPTFSIFLSNNEATPG